MLFSIYLILKFYNLKFKNKYIFYLFILIKNITINKILKKEF